MVKKYQNNLLRFFIYISLLLAMVSILANTFKSNTPSLKKSLVNSTINYKDEDNLVNVNYPRLKNNKIDKIISNYIYDYVRKFRLLKEKNKKLTINYEIYHINNYINIVFLIDNNYDKIKFKNFIFNTSTNSLSYITNLFDKKFLERSINEIVYYKYSQKIYDSIKNSNINNHTYLINDDKIDVYFCDINFKDIDYIPHITILLNEKTVKFQNNHYKYNKYIAFTFDDGPTKYTSELLKTIEVNNSSATFFMIGNRMKYNYDVVKEVYNSSSEIGSHTYSHKSLANLSKKELEKEINSVQIIYNEITNDYIKYLRPPYGIYNDKVTSLDYSLILWNIDTKDWLNKNPVKIYNYVIKNACDGCIVLMHDTNFETIEAIRKIIPSLNELGYNVVSISKLIETKKYELKNGQAIRQIK